jgi:hypothetical protein
VEETVLDGFWILMDFRFDCNNIDAVMYARIVFAMSSIQFSFYELQRVSLPVGFHLHVEKLLGIQ